MHNCAVLKYLNLFHMKCAKLPCLGAHFPIFHLFFCYLTLCFYQCIFQTFCWQNQCIPRPKTLPKYVTQSEKTGLIAYLKVSMNAGFKYLVCCSSPMVEATCTKLSHVLHQFLTFQSIHCASSQQLSFQPF